MEQRVKRLAERERRSVHAQLLTLIEAGLTVEERKIAKEGRS